MTRRDKTPDQAYRLIVLPGLTIVLCLFVIMPALFVYAADPCHVFHKPFKGLLDHGFTPETRCQNAGLINSWLSDPAEGFDSVLIGASTSDRS